MALKLLIKEMKNSLSGTVGGNLYKQQNQNNEMTLRFVPDHLKRLTQNIVRQAFNNEAKRMNRGGRAAFNLTTADDKAITVAVDTVVKAHVDVTVIENLFTAMGYKIAPIGVSNSTQAIARMGKNDKPIRVRQRGGTVEVDVFAAAKVDPMNDRAAASGVQRPTRRFVEILVEESIQDLADGHFKRKGHASSLSVRGKNVNISDMKRRATTKGQFSMRGGTGRVASPLTQSFRRLHGGELMHSSQRTKATPPDTAVDATTATLTDFVEKLRDKNRAPRELLKRNVGAMSQTSNNAVDVVNRKIVRRLDMYYEINGHTISDIIKHQRDIRITYTLGDDLDQNWMSDADYGRKRRGVGKILNKIEADIIKTNKKFLKNPKNKASRAPVDQLTGQAAKSVIKNMFGHKTRPDMRLKVNKQLLKERRENSREKIKGNFNLAKGSKKVKSTRARAKGKGKSVATATGVALHTDKAGANPMALRTLLNEMLPQAIAANMTAPALQYRTGRFANSVRIDNITQGPRGGNTMIEASYRNDPYETFAPGGKKYTFQRDPERLIKGTIREVATGLIGARFGIEVN